MSATRPLSQRAASWLLRFLDRLEIRWSRSSGIDGLWVGVAAGNAFTSAFSRVEQALSLIKVHDPNRYARLLRDLDCIWVTLLPGSQGRFRDAFKSCDLDERFVLADATTPEEIASVIVHEATHARLMRRGIGYGPELRARVERICIRRQRAFAARLPNGEQVQAEAEWGLREIPADYWADEALRERRLQGDVENLRHVGAPEFVIRAALALRALIIRIRDRRKG